MKLTGVMINSENPKALSDFYTKILGKPAWEDGEFVGFTADGGMLMVGPHSDVKGKNNAPGRLMVTLECEDVKAEFARMSGQGAEVVAEPYNPSDDDKTLWLATVADPDGNYLQLASPWKPM